MFRAIWMSVLWIFMLYGTEMTVWSTEEVTHHAKMIIWLVCWNEPIVWLADWLTGCLWIVQCLVCMWICDGVDFDQSLLLRLLLLMLLLVLLPLLPSINMNVLHRWTLFSLYPADEFEVRREKKRKLHIFKRTTVHCPSFVEKLFLSKLFSVSSLTETNIDEKCLASLG